MSRAGRPSNAGTTDRRDVQPRVDALALLISTTLLSMTLSMTTACSGPATEASASASPPSPPPTISEGPSTASSGPFVGSEEIGKRDAPTLRLLAPEVVGRLPPEVVERIVRQNFGRFTRCYESARKTTPDLQGVVKVVFTVAKDGSVVSPTTRHGELKDPALTDCIGAALGTLSFPQPEGGVVKVTMPMEFRLASGPATVRGRPIPEVTVSDVAEVMKSLGYAEVMVKLAGSAPSPMLVVGSKDGLVATATFVSFSRAATDPPVSQAERARLEAQGSVFTEGEFFLAVEIPGKKSEAEALLRALLGRAPGARQTQGAR